MKRYDTAYHGEGEYYKCADVDAILAEKDKETSLYKGRLATAQLAIGLLQEQLRASNEALGIAQQALIEVRHAQVVGADWYTKGASGLYQQVAMWVNRGLEAIASNPDLTALAERDAKRDKEVGAKAAEIEREACKKDIRTAGNRCSQMYGDGAECLSTAEECINVIDMRSNAELRAEG